MAQKGVGLFINPVQLDELVAYRPLGTAPCRYQGRLPGLAVALGFVDAMAGQRHIASDYGDTTIEIDLPTVCPARRGSPEEGDETVVTPPP